MSKTNNNWIIFNNKNSLSRVLALEILNIAEKSIFKKNFFSIVLTGGQSTLSLYKILSESDSNWSKWHVYISDERFLPKNHEDRNDSNIYKIWLNDSLIPKENIHFIQAELGLVSAQNKYERMLNKVDKFDVLLLSIGEDGHISSLFPGHKYCEIGNVVIERNSPKLPKERISMSYNRLNNTVNVFKIVTGEHKQIIVKKLLDGDKFPANYINGKVETFFIHADSMPNIKRK
jgi:6-phosphogluconolactonase